MRTNSTTFGTGVFALANKNLGYIVQIIGPVLNVAFSPYKMPNNYILNFFTKHALHMSYFFFSC